MGTELHPGPGWIHDFLSSLEGYRITIQPRRLSGKEHVILLSYPLRINPNRPVSHLNRKKDPKEKVCAFSWGDMSKCLFFRWGSGYAMGKSPVFLCLEGSNNFGF